MILAPNQKLNQIVGNPYNHHTYIHTYIDSHVIFGASHPLDLLTILDKVGNPSVRQWEVDPIRA